MRRVPVWVLIGMGVAVAASVMFLICYGLWARYWGDPVRVTISFDYGGKHYERSYLTMERPEFCYPMAPTCWHLVHSRIATDLPDGSLIVAEPMWTGGLKRYSSLEVGERNIWSTAWIWVDNRRSPTQIDSGGTANQLQNYRSEPPPFIWIWPHATVERLSDEWTWRAVRADMSSDSTEQGETESYPDRPHSVGDLFFQFTLIPVLDERYIRLLKNRGGWLRADNNCRIKPFAEGPGTLAGFGFPSEQIGLLRRGSTWSDENGTRWDEPRVAYDSGLRVGTDGRYPWPPPLSHLIHAVKWNGQYCSGIDLKSRPDAIGFAVIFPDGTIGVVLVSSGAVVWDNWRA